MSDIAKHLIDTLDQIQKVALMAGRPPASVRLTAVSKTHTAQAVSIALATGHRIFGENRIQEAAQKFPPLKKSFPDIELHLIGPLQTNKVAQAVALFDVIETLDRPKLAAELAKEIKKQNRHPRLYIEVNTGNEPQKAGLPPEEVESFLKECRTLHGLKISGLMGIPPQGEDPTPHFRLLTGLAQKLDLPDLSMGMSSDFEKAIQCGATEVRIGTAIFGQRETTFPLCSA